VSALVVDSCVVAKWIVPEQDSDKARAMLKEAVSAGDELVVVDIVLPELVNVIWKRRRRGLTTLEEARALLKDIGDLPIRVEPSAPLLAAAFEIAVKYDRSVYDALFLALAEKLKARGVTADEPLFTAARAGFPQIRLLRSL
jgi:predicted nucleic acid-binding protein